MIGDIRTIISDTDADGREIRIRVERDAEGLFEVAEEYSPGSRVRTSLKKIGAVTLTGAEAEFVRDALSEILGDRDDRGWLERLPTPAEVAAHAQAHPSRWFDEERSGFGAWLCMSDTPTLVRLRAGDDGHVWLDDGDELTETRCPGARWRPCTAEGLTLALPRVDS